MLLTSKSQKEDLIEGMEAGADDYITKPFDQHELQVRLRAGTRLVDLQAELLSAREALREQATKDSLTHLWNRSSIFDILCRELARGQRERNPVGVVMVDLDHFKSINDNYGHFAGDAVLCEAARRMQNAIRQYDSIGRYGGEEFLILLSGCDQETSLSQAERLRKQLSQYQISLQESSIGDQRQLRGNHRASGPILDAGGTDPQSRRSLIPGQASGTQSSGVSGAQRSSGAGAARGRARDRRAVKFGS